MREETTDGEVCSGRQAGAAGERGYRGRSSKAAAAGVEGTGDSTRSLDLLSLGSIASGSLAWGQGPFYLGGFGNIELSGGALPLPRAVCRGRAIAAQTSHWSTPNRDWEEPLTTPVVSLWCKITRGARLLLKLKAGCRNLGPAGCSSWCC